MDQLKMKIAGSCSFMELTLHPAILGEGLDQCDVFTGIQRH